MPTEDRVKALGRYFQIEQIQHSWGMNEIWPQRIIFRAHLKDYLAKAKQTQQQFADEVGITLDHLHNCLYRPEKRLSLDVIQKASRLFSRYSPGERSVLNYIDDPGGFIAGQDMSNESEQTRFFTSLIVKDMKSEDLTDDDKRFIWEDYLRAVERVRLGRARASGFPGGDLPPGELDEVSSVPGSGPNRVLGSKKGR